MNKRQKNKNIKKMQKKMITKSMQLSAQGIGIDSIGYQNINSMYCPLMKDGLRTELIKYQSQTLMVVLKMPQLNVLNQVFRPIFCGTIAEVNLDYILMTNVNIKMIQAPEYVFPTPLMIPLKQIAWYMPFDPAVRFSLY